MRKPRFASVRFRFWGVPRITKRVEKGGWVRHNLAITARVCWRVTDVLVGGIFIPEGNTSVTPQDVIDGKPVLARVLPVQPVEEVSLARIEVLAKVKEPKHDVIVAPIRALILNDGNKCIQKIKIEQTPNTHNINIVIVKPHPTTKVVIMTVPTGSPATMRFDYQLKRAIISREEIPF